MKIAISRDLGWIMPFLAKASPFVPLDSLTFVKGYKQKKTQEIDSYGGILKYRGKYTITLLTHSYSKKKKKHVEMHKGIIIPSLAHELAHMVHFEHGWQHFYLEAVILNAWADVVRKQNIKLW